MMQASSLIHLTFVGKIVRRLHLIVIMFFVGACVPVNDVTLYDSTPTEWSKPVQPTIIPDAKKTPESPIKKPTAQPMISPTIMAPTPTPTVISELCVWPPVAITDDPDSFSWLPNDTLFFALKNEFWIYFPQDRQLVLSAEGNPQVPEEEYKQQLASNFGVTDYDDIFASPDGKIIIYLLSSSEDGYKQVYMKMQLDNSIYLDEIYGKVDDVFWLGDERLIIAIDGWAPPGTKEAFAYLVSLTEMGIVPLLPINEFRNVQVLGASPDGEYILFRQLIGNARDLWLLRMQTGEARSLALYSPIDFAWVPGENQFIAIGKLQEGTRYNLYTYDYVDNTTRILSNPIQSGFPFLAYFSPSSKYVVFTGVNHNNREDNHLYLLDCPFR